MKRIKKILPNFIGIVCLAGLAFLLVLAHNAEKREVKSVSKSSSKGNILFQNDITYNGKGNLDLLFGVSADDGIGNDVIRKVNATIAAGATINKKVVNYSLVDASGNTITAKRNLTLVGYTGPNLKVNNNISIEADNLNDIITVLHNKNELFADNGYGKDITNSVKCQRKKISGSTYEFIFSVTNEFNDSKSTKITAKISGNVNDPTIKLSKSYVKLRLHEEFDPQSYITSAKFGNTDALANVKISSSVNTAEKGAYTVIYELSSSDKTATTQETLKVTVE